MNKNMSHGTGPSVAQRSATNVLHPMELDLGENAFPPSVSSNLFCSILYWHFVSLER